MSAPYRYAARRLFQILLLASLSTAASCGLFVRDDDPNGNGTGNGNGNGEITCPGDPGCPADTVRVYDVRDPARRAELPPGEEITLEGVIVTAVRTRFVSNQPRYDIFVQDPDGGPWSAIQLAAVATRPEPGDVLTLTGSYDAYFGQDQIAGVTFQVTGSADLPEPEIFEDPSEIATGGAEAYRWQSALVGVEHVEVTDARILGTDGNWRGDFRVTGDLVVGRIFPHDYDAVENDHFLSITGVLAHSFDESRLQPRENADLVFIDGTLPGPAVETIYELRAYEGDLSGDGRLVRVEDVVVSAISAPDNWDRQNLFLQEPDGGPFSGIYVYNLANQDMSDLTVGDRVTVEGRHVLFALPGDERSDDQISLRELIRLGPGDPPVPVQIEDPATLLDPDAGADAWEGVLVEIQEVTVTHGANQYGEVRLSGAPKLAPALMGAGALDGYGEGDHFTSVVGALQWRFGYALLPRSDDDLVAGEAQPPPEPQIVEIADVRDPARRADLDPGPVTVEGIVTAVRPRSGRYDVFIQSADAGPYDAITVAFVTLAPAPGDVVEATGTYESFYGWDRLGSAEIEVVEAGGPLPSPLVLPAATLAAESDDGFEYQSLLVQVADVTVVDDRILGTDGVWRGDFEVDDGLRVGRWFPHGYDAVVDDAFESITGVVRYSFDEYRLEPREGGDLVFEGGGSPTDPDPDPEPLTVTIPQLQDESHVDHPELGTLVEVAEAVVTGVRVVTRADLTTYVDGFVMQTIDTSAPYAGIFVYMPDRPDGGTIERGHRIRVVGEFTTFRTMPQISADSFEVLGTAELPSPYPVADPASFEDVTQIRPLLHVLVKVAGESDLEVTEGSDEYGEYRVDGIMRVRDYLYPHTTTTGDLFTSMTGIVGYFETFAGNFAGYRLWPRSADDLETP